MRVAFPEVVIKDKPNTCGFVDLENCEFGRLKVIGYAGRYRKYSEWYCGCACGSLCRTTASRLKQGKTRSCGCLASETTTARSTKHGHARRGAITAR